jgi:hypothetical protein
MKIGVLFQWIDSGEIRLDSAAKPEFPKLSAIPGVYAFRFVGKKETTVYIGEAENLRRRAAHYRNPGPSQITNIRLNEKMRSHLAADGRITLHLITAAKVEVDGSSEECDMSSNFVRRFLENAALLAVARTAEKVENL